MTYYILEGHNPVSSDLLDWAQWMENNNRVVSQTNLKIDGKEVLVSTVFLGLDHNFNDKGPPILFETMIFGSSLDGEQERYATWSEAEEGHLQMLDRMESLEPLGEANGRS